MSAISKETISCVDYAKELFDTPAIKVGLYHEQLVTSTLSITGVEITPYFESKSTHALVKLSYRNVNEILSDLQTEEEKTAELLVFSGLSAINHAFTDWQEEFKLRLFKGKLPLTIALDIVKNNINILTIDKNSSVELQLFAELSSEEMDSILSDISTDKPFRFDLSKEVLMDIISGEEGYRYAYDNLQIVFNCTTEVSYQKNIIL